MDILQFDIKFERYPTEPEGKLHLGIEAWINGQEVAPWWHLPLDFDALKESAVVYGAYFFWTCSCGHPECAGLREGIQVVHSKDLISWISPPAPIADFGDLHFDRVAYKQAIDRALAQRDYQADLHHANGQVFEFVAHRAEDRGWYEGESVVVPPRFLTKVRPKKKGHK